MKPHILFTFILTGVFIAFTGCTNDTPHFPPSNNPMEPSVGPEVYLGWFQASMDLGPAYLTGSTESNSGGSLKICDTYCTLVNGDLGGTFAGSITHFVYAENVYSQHYGAGEIDLGDEIVFDVTLRGQSVDGKMQGAMEGIFEEEGYVLEADYEDDPRSPDGCRLVCIRGRISDN